MKPARKKPVSCCTRCGAPSESLCTCKPAREAAKVVALAAVISAARASVETGDLAGLRAALATLDTLT